MEYRAHVEHALFPFNTVITRVSRRIRWLASKPFHVTKESARVPYLQRASLLSSIKQTDEVFTVPTTPYPGPYPATIADILVHHITTTPATAQRTKSKAEALRRQPNKLQGLALEKLGHAIEYLVDSRFHGGAEVPSRSDTEAGEILMRLSRDVFAECRPVSPSPSILHKLVRLSSTYNSKING
jgi:hypothetical protein